MVDITMEKQKAEKVQPTYVLISPYAFQNNKFVEYVAKFGSLLFAVIFFTCMITLHLKTSEYSFWVLCLPQFVFFILTFIIGCISNNKTFQLVQIVLTYISLNYTYSVTCFTVATFRPNTLMVFPVVLFLTVFLLYAIALQIVHRKHYVKDLSTPESVSTLNKIDFCHILVFVVCICTSVPLASLLEPYMPFWLYTQTELEKFEINPVTFIGTFIFLFHACGFVYLTSVLLILYYKVNYWNSVKSTTHLSSVIIDSDGRPWFSVSHQVNLLFSQLKSLFCRCASKLTGQKSSVQPAEPQKVPLKPLADLNV